METILSDNFWNLFHDKFNELVKNYNFIKSINSYNMESITNDKYLIEIDYYTHPQFEEVQLSVKILYIDTNDKLYEKKYILLENIYKTTITLEESIENFINKFFDEIIKKINV